MRPYLPILLLAILLLNLCGMYVAFEWKRESIRTQVGHSLFSKKKEELREFSFTHAQFAALDWHKKNREFKLDDKMYDIAKLERSATQVRVWAEYDKEESKLIKYFAVLQHSSGDDATSSPVKLLVKSLLQEFTQETSSPLASFQQQRQLPFASLTFPLLFRERDAIFSPPDLG